MSNSVYAVPIYCTFSFNLFDWSRRRSCDQPASAHVHTPMPCENGQDASHHEFTPPRFINVQLDGDRRPRRLKVAV